MKKQLLLFFVLFFTNLLLGQVTNTATIDTAGSVRIGNITVGGFIDTYYTYNFSNPNDKNIPYLSSAARHNEVNLNLAFLDLRYASKRIRCRFVAGYGTMMITNYANEPIPLKFLVETSIGVKPFKKYDMWIYGGILGSPFTNESFLSKDHLMYSRSLSAENVPYYLTGFKLVFPINDKLNFSLYGLNGWQNIDERNDGKAITTQLEYKPNDNLLFNWNVYIGDEKSDSFPELRTRYFSDIFMIYSKKNLDMTSSIYLGIQQKIDSLNNESFPIWYSANFIARYKFSKTLSLSGRVEYFRDQNNVLQTPATIGKDYHTLGTGLCFNVAIADNFLFRVEGRYFYGLEKIYFNRNGTETNHNGQVSASFAAWF